MLYNLVAASWIFFSKHYLNNILRDVLFTKNPLKTFDDSINLLADIGLYAGLYMVSLTFTVMFLRVVNHSINPATSARL